jgi:hypothetical protein
VILITFAFLGAVTGAAGVATGFAAHRRVNRVLEESAALLRTQTHSGSGMAEDRTLRDLAVVHYDALTEMSGQLSFSLALLNAAGDGVVLSSINGRTETRTYAKAVRSGRSTQQLSPEEQQVVRAARLGQGPEVRLSERWRGTAERGATDPDVITDR